MQSKRSCFNKQIFVRNLKLYWPLWVLSLIVAFLVIPVSFIRVGNDLSGDLTNIEIKNAFVHSLSYIYPFAMGASSVYAIIAATIINSYLFNTSKATFYHAIPIKRSELFFTNTKSGLLFIVVPGFIACLAGTIVGFCFGVNLLPEVSMLLLGLVVSVLFFYSFASLCTMVTGQAASAFVFYAVLVPYLDIMCYPISNVSLRFMYGISNNIMEDISRFSPFNILSRMIDFTDEKGTQVDYVALVIFLVLAALIFFITYKLYMYRKLETAGDTVCFPFIRPVFRWGVGISAMFAFGSVMPVIFVQENSKYYLAITVIIGMISGLVGFAVAEMIMKKTFRIFKHSFKEMLVFTGVMAAFFLILNVDLFGVEKKVPDPAKVESIYISYDGYSFDVEEPEDIKSATEFHKYIVDNKDLIAEQTEQYFGGYYGDVNMIRSLFKTDDLGFTYGEGLQGAYISFEYELSNGDTLKRSYTLLADPEIRDPKTIQGRICQFFDDPSIIKEMVLPDGDIRNNIKYIETDLYKKKENPALEYYEDGEPVPSNFGNSYDMKNVVITENEAVDLFDALIKDIDEGNLRFNYDRYYDDMYISNLYIEFEDNEKDGSLNDRDSYRKFIRSVGIDISGTCKNVIGFFEKGGYFDDGFGFVTSGDYYK